MKKILLLTSFVVVAGLVFSASGLSGKTKNLANAQEESVDQNEVTGWKAALTGDQEIPPINTSAAGGLSLKFDRENNRMEYKLKVSGIDDISAAHLHLGAKGQNGDIVVALKTSGAARPEGQTTWKSFTTTDLVGPLAGMTLNDLAQKINAGDIYVNVHTSQNPKGLIRGQVR